MSDDRPAAGHEVVLYVEGLAGAVTTEQLVTTATARGAPPRVVETLVGLPSRRWPSVEDAIAAIGTGAHDR